MLEEAYSACQPADDHDTARLDGYLNWVLELANQARAHRNDAGYAMAWATQTNPLTGRPLGKWFDLFYGDVTA